MPLVELTIDETATLETEAVATALCDLVIATLGGDPANPATQEITRCEVTRRAIRSAGQAAPRAARVRYTMPAGSLSRVRKARLAARTTRLVLAHQARPECDPGYDVWVTFEETAYFAAAGQFWTPREIARWVLSPRLIAAE